MTNPADGAPAALHGGEGEDAGSAALIAQIIERTPYPRYSYVAQNRDVETARAARYARAIARRVAEAFSRAAQPS